MQREPFLSLLDAVVVKFVVHAPRAQRREQVTPDVLRKLTAMNQDVGDRRHPLVVAETRRWDKSALRLRGLAPQPEVTRLVGSRQRGGDETAVGLQRHNSIAPVQRPTGAAIGRLQGKITCPSRPRN